MSLLLRKFWPYLLVGLILLVLYVVVWETGITRGKSEVQSLWDIQKAKDTKATLKLQEEIRTKEFKHTTESQRISDELAKTKSEYQANLAKQSVVYAQRLQQSQTRAEVYQRQAQGGEAQCRDLASYAAKLDGSLEEGRSLVRELGDTLRFRDQQIIQLGQQIKSDRLLLDDTVESDK